MTGSVLSETFLSSARMGLNLNFMDDQGRGLSAPLLRLVTSRPLRNGLEDPCVPSETENPGLIKVAKANVDAAPEGQTTKDDVETAWYPEDCVWDFGFGARYAISQELGRQLDDLDMQRTSGVAVGTIAAKNMWRNGTATLTSIDDYFQALAEVMTAAVRNRGRTEDYARGQVTVSNTCVSVRWAWLSYPAALVGLAVIFLVLVFAQSPREPSFRVWKSSPLALLFLSMDESRYDANYYGMTKNDINQFAETVSVQLKLDQDGKVIFS